jgi:hypothetical protein
MMRRRFSASGIRNAGAKRHCELHVLVRSSEIDSVAAPITTVADVPIWAHVNARR